MRLVFNAKKKRCKIVVVKRTHKGKQHGAIAGKTHRDLNSRGGGQVLEKRKRGRCLFRKKKARGSAR